MPFFFFLKNQGNVTCIYFFVCAQEEGIMDAYALAVPMYVFVPIIFFSNLPLKKICL